MPSCLPVFHGGELRVVTIHGAATPGGLGGGGGEAQPGVIGPLTADAGAAAVVVAPAQPAVRRRGADPAGRGAGGGRRRRQEVVLQEPEKTAGCGGS
jgi:hypothetical protein